jgi:hypothetical protein
LHQLLSIEAVGSAPEDQAVSGHLNLQFAHQTAEAPGKLDHNPAGVYFEATMSRWR